VRRIDVHGAFAHGAVPRTNASSGETKVTEVAANPLGTGPPADAVTVGVVVGGVLAALLAAEAEPEADVAPPEVADAVDDADEPPPLAPELAAPHADSATADSATADSATADSSAPDGSAARDHRNDVFMKSPSAVDRSLRLWRRHSSAPG
jgi:hypothetical protein